MRRTYIRAQPDPGHSAEGVAVAASYQMNPRTGTPYKARGIAHTAKTERTVEISFTPAEARKLVEDWISFGLFGRHGRVVDTKP